MLVLFPTSAALLMADLSHDISSVFFFCRSLSLSLSLSLNDNQKLFLLRRLPDRARRDLRDPSSLKKRSRLLIPFPLLALSAIVLVCRHK
jgi:hypothetical protein